MVNDEKMPMTPSNFEVSEYHISACTATEVRFGLRAFRLEGGNVTLSIAPDKAARLARDLMVSAFRSFEDQHGVLREVRESNARTRRLLETWIERDEQRGGSHE